MTLASRITDLVTAIAAAINARSGMVGSSAYDLYVATGGTLTLAQWQLMQQGGMTAAQRAALTGVDLWRGREVTETDTGITWRYVSSTTGWKRWSSDWIDVSTTNLIPTGFTGTFNGTNGWRNAYARYRYWDGRVVFEAAVSLNGSAGFSSADVTIALPVAMDFLRTPSVSGKMGYYDASSSAYFLMEIGTINVNTVTPWVRSGANGYIQGISANNNLPVAAAINDTIEWSMTFTPA